jgi:hypothetical protein
MIKKWKRNVKGMISVAGDVTRNLIMNRVRESDKENGNIC